VLIICSSCDMWPLQELKVGWFSVDVSSVVLCRISGRGLRTPCFKKTSTHIIGYKLRNSCPIFIIFDTKIPHII